VGQPQTAINIEYNSRRKRSLLQELSFDAWGDRRNPATWRSFTGTPPEPLFDRGFTGHEHLYAFGLINMNGRMYDPLVSRMLSPDNFIQAPDFSQSFNRYSYCLNNPLKYTDPSGKLFIIDDWVIGFVKGFARSISGKHEDGHHTWFGDAWASANRHAGNSAKIWGGLFAADTDRGGWQIVSRFTWQLPQTILGFGAAHGENMIGQVDNVGYCEGATVVTKKGERAFFGQTTAYTLGSYIIGGNDLQPNVRNPLFQHEYGHYLQSQAAGWAYIPRFAIPSALNPSRNGGYTDLSEDTEQDAQARSLLYFTKYVDGFTYDDWDYYEHPFYDRPDGTIVNRTKINESFLNGKLMIPTYIQELIINHVRNSTRNYYSGY